MHEMHSEKMLAGGGEERRGYADDAAFEQV